MQITPVKFLSGVNYRPLNTKAQPNETVPSFSAAARKREVPYPRRYLPQYYPVVSASKKTYDSFTGMRDKNYLMEVIKATMNDQTHQNSALSIAMFDMDNFKSVNELLGYKTGDSFIKAISQKITRAARENSIGAYRFGGEEFVLVFNNQPKAKQEKIVNGIVQSINDDEYIKSKGSEYKKNADAKLKEYYLLHSKIDPIIPLMTKRSMFKDLRDNFETPEAKNDPYLLKSISDADTELRDLYLSLIDERLSEEEDNATKDLLLRVKKSFGDNGKISKSEEKELNEYLFSVYDKTFEIHQIKKWISDFDQNGGFSVTGGVVHYTPESMKDKSPIDIINEAGEVLKQGKNTKKGCVYQGRAMLS